MTRLWQTLGLAGLAAVAAAPALAHHSFAMFQTDKVVALKGEVAAFEWTNPHAWLHVTVVNAAGKPQEWAFEMVSPLQLTSQGWKPDTLKVGEPVIIRMHPTKDGSRGGSFMMAILADGEVVGRGVTLRPSQIPDTPPPG